jgi:hypothetical protein
VSLLRPTSDPQPRSTREMCLGRAPTDSSTPGIQPKFGCCGTIQPRTALRPNVMERPNTRKTGRQGGWFEVRCGTFDVDSMEHRAWRIESRRMRSRCMRPNYIEQLGDVCRGRIFGWQPRVERAHSDSSRPGVGSLPTPSATRSRELPSARVVDESCIALHRSRTSFLLTGARNGCRTPSTTRVSIRVLRRGFAAACTRTMAPAMRTSADR